MDDPRRKDTRMLKTLPPERSDVPSPVEILQQLIRFNTTNPPGDETACVLYVRDLLQAFGIESRVLSKVDSRANLVARIRGRGLAPPLMLYGHVDVVTTVHQEWTYPPFDGKLVDGYVWGRGALDMKGGIAMMLSALLDVVFQGFQPAGDIVLVVLSDEETGGSMGANFLVDRYPEIFEGIRYALGEFGGHTTYIGPQRFYPIQIAEKQLCWMKATVRGPGGHGARPMRNGAMARLGCMLKAIDRRRLPVHVTPVAKQMVHTMAACLPGLRGALFRQLCNPYLTDALLKLMGENGKTLEPIFHNTVNATIVAGGEKINVIPSEIQVDLDGRLLPGFGPSDVMAELQAILGNDIELAVTKYEPCTNAPDMHLFGFLGDVIQRIDPEGVAVPLLMPAFTDARHFARIGIQTYGFTPMKLPPEFKFSETVHGANERIPVAALLFGARAMGDVIRHYTG
jgi:acetylornithine deacetylase/succinyl-diaminopimelate desuccinylase-like protein